MGSVAKLAGLENQDYADYIENDDFVVLALADGVSSELKSKIGARLAVDSILELFAEKGEFFFEFDNKTAIHIILEHILFKLTKEAYSNGRSINDYSSTLAAVMVNKKNKIGLLFNLGDSTILGFRDNKGYVLSKPFNTVYGTCVTTTRNAKSAVSLTIMDLEGFTSVMLLSDGLWKNMLKGGCIVLGDEEMVTGTNFGNLYDYIKYNDFNDDATVITLSFDV